MLPWLSFFLRGGFMFLVEVNIGASSIYTLLVLLLNAEGLLKLRPNPMSYEMISSDWSPLKGLLLPKVFCGIS